MIFYLSAAVVISYVFGIGLWSLIFEIPLWLMQIWMVWVFMFSNEEIQAEIIARIRMVEWYNKILSILVTIYLLFMYFEHQHFIGGLTSFLYTITVLFVVYRGKDVVIWYVDSEEELEKKFQELRGETQLQQRRSDGEQEGQSEEVSKKTKTQGENE